MRNGFRWVWVGIALCVCMQTAGAHPIGFSGFRFLVWQDHAQAIYTLHTRDMGDWFPPLKYPDYVKDVCTAIIAKPEDLLDVTFDGDTIPATDKRAFSPETGMIQVELTYPIKKFPASLALWSKQLIHLPRGHQQLLFVEDMRANPNGESGPSLYEGALSADQDGATIDVPATSTSFIASTTAPTTTPATSQSSTQPAPEPALGEHSPSPSRDILTRSLQISLLTTSVLLALLIVVLWKRRR